MPTNTLKSRNSSSHRESLKKTSSNPTNILYASSYKLPAQATNSYNPTSTSSSNYSISHFSSRQLHNSNASSKSSLSNYPTITSTFQESLKFKKWLFWHPHQNHPNHSKLPRCNQNRTKWELFGCDLGQFPIEEKNLRLGGVYRRLGDANHSISALLDDLTPN